MSNSVIITLIICVTLVAMSAISKIGEVRKQDKTKEAIEKIFNKKEDK